MKRYTSVVVGLGNIGVRLDLAAGKNRVATHARAFATHSGYKLAAGVDPNATARSLFEQHYCLPAFPDIAAMRAVGIRPEIYSIATPTPLHARVYAEALAQKPLAILCEKPLAESVLDAERMVVDAKTVGCVLAVNYIRRFEPGVLRLRQLIAGGTLGEVYKGSAWYTKGLLNNGSHVVDLLAFLLGKIDDAQVLHPGRVWQGGDPEPDVRLRIGAAQVMLLAAREECFSYIGFELVGTEGVLRYFDGGHRIELRRARTEPALPGYRMLSAEAELLETDLNRYQWHAVDAIHRCLTEGVPLESSGESALETLRVIERIHGALVAPIQNGSQP
ncbi:MAG: putative 4,5-dihydroxyphthalate dehydrogenase [Nitrosomonadaceae bacterium]|nr:putative 4,5-dihydroxyphthalate dehydrogenase [Nitrosomonadaceae bacterium]